MENTDHIRTIRPARPTSWFSSSVSLFTIQSDKLRSRSNFEPKAGSTTSAIMAGCHTFKLPWQGSKQTDKNAEELEKTAKESKEVENPDAPPPYSERSSQDPNEDDLSNRNALYSVLTSFAKENDLIRRSNLQWILVDIAAVTFSTYVGRLIRALLKSDPTWARSMIIEDSSSIWDGKCKLLALETCALVRYLQRQVPFV